METVALLYEDYQKELAEDFKNTFLKRASDTDSSRSNDTVIDEVTDMLSTNIAVYTEKLLQRWGFSSGGEGGGGGDVTVTLDDLLKKYLSDNYVTIKGDQEVFGEKDFRKGIRIAGRRLYWDEGNDALVIEGAAYTTRWLSAKGVSPGGGGAGSGGAAAMYQLIDVSPNDTKDAVLGAEKDYVLTFDGSFWRGMPNKGGLSSKLFTALDKEGHEINPDDENAEIYAIRANYSLWSVGFLSAKGISDGGTGGGGGGAVALYQLLDVEKNADITGVAGATKGSVLTFNGDKWYADKPKTAAGISNLFTALDKDGNEVDLNDESKLGTITNIRANYALWSVDWISAKGKSSGGSGGGGGLINLVYGFESLGGTFDNNDNSATFNAFTINEIWKLASSGLTNVTVTGSGNAVTDVIKGSDGRSLTFTKGSTFATKSEFDALNTKFNDFLTGSDADDIINKWSELEVFLQGMKESDNLAVILQSKMDKTAFSKLFTALDASGNEVDPSDDTKTIASIRANFGFWGVDYISAKGVSKGSGGTGGASTLYQLVDVLANDTEDGVEGAAAGKALVFDGTHWRAGDAGLNESQLYSYLTANKYLTQSAADSRYVTSSRKVIAGTGLSGGGALTSDVTLSLGTSGVVAGTYTKVMVDAYGRVTSGTNLSATDIPNLDWSKITTGKPTTLAGYGITDAVTLTTAQTISGRKTFSQNIVFNNNGGITYTDSNVVLRNSDGHTILASFGNGEISLRPNGHNNTEGAVWINKKGNVQAPSVSTNTITIGDAQLVYDSANKALRVKHRTDGNTVGFYSDGWVSALGVKTGGSGGGSGVVNTVYSFANLTDGTTFSDSDLDNTFNAYTIKKLYDMAGQGGLDADAMWAELKKADSSKVIDASHIPTSVLDGRWVTLSTNQTITGQKTFTQQLKSTVATGVSPFAVDSTTIVKNLNVNFLDGRRADSFTSIIGRHSIDTSGTAPYNYIHLFRIANSVGYSTLRVDIDIKTRYHRALLFIDISTNQHPYGESGTSINISKLQLNSQGASLYYTVTKQSSGYNYYDIYYNSGAWNTGSYDVILRGISGGLVFEPKNTKMNNLPSGYVEVIKTLLDGDISGNAATATALKNSRTLWGQPFNGTANVSGNMTGVGSITMSGNLEIGNGTSPNAILFYGTTGDSPGGYNHTFIAERLWGGTESGELVLFKGNDIGNGTDAITASNAGPDRIRHIAAAHLFQTYTTALSGPVESVCTSSALKNLFSIASNRVISYVQLQSTIASGTAPFIVASNTVVGNLNADLLDGVHAERFLLSVGRSDGTFDLNTYSERAIKEIRTTEQTTNNAPFSGYGLLANLWDSNKFAALQIGGTSTDLFFRGKHDGTNKITSAWHRLLHTENYASIADGRYVKKAGDIMTGDLTMNNTKGFNIGWSTRVVKTSGVWIHGGGDTASSTDANLRFASWYGIGWYPTIDSTSGVRQGNNAMWLNVRTGVLDVHSNITSHNGYLAANWDSARRLVLGGGGSYAWIASRNSSDNVLCNIVLQDNKVVIGNYAESSRFVSTVGTGKAPYQCNSTTLNTNLNADLLDGNHGAYYQNRVCDIFVAQYNQYDYIEFLRFVIPSGQPQLRAYVVFDLCRTETGNESNGRAVLRLRRYNDNTAGTRFYATNFGRTTLPELRCTSDDGITWRIWMKCNKSGYDPYIAVKIVEQYPYGYVTTQNNGTTGTPSGSKYTVVAGIAGISNAANILVNTRNIFGQPFNGSGDVGGQMTSTSIFVQTGDATLKVYSGRITDARSDGNICLQTSIDATDGQSHSYPTQYQSRCNLSLQPRGGQVYIGQNPDGGDTGYKLTVNGSIKSNGNIIATGAITAKASSSDIRLKTDIQGYDAMGIIRKFRSVKYHWNAVAKENSEVFNHDNWNYGLIAQDLLSGGYTQWVKDIFNDYYTIDYERLIPVVWKGLQEVDDEVTRLKKRVRELEKRLGIN